MTIRAGHELALYRTGKRYLCAASLAEQVLVSGKIDRYDGMTIGAGRLCFGEALGVGMTSEYITAEEFHLDRTLWTGSRSNPEIVENWMPRYIEVKFIDLRATVLLDSLQRTA